MDREPSGRVKKKDRTGPIISLVVHIVVIADVLYFVSKTKLGQQIKEHLLGASRAKKEENRPKPPPAAPRRSPLKAPAGAPPPASGARRAADAPAAVGEGFF